MEVYPKLSVAPAQAGAHPPIVGRNEFGNGGRALGLAMKCQSIDCLDPCLRRGDGLV